MFHHVRRRGDLGISVQPRGGQRADLQPVLEVERAQRRTLAGDDNRPIEAIWWRGVEEAEQTPKANERIDLAYELEANRWQGDIRVQLNVKDLKSGTDFRKL